MINYEKNFKYKIESFQMRHYYCLQLNESKWVVINIKPHFLLIYTIIWYCDTYFLKYFLFKNILK
jgi:hypothetical protein